VLEIGTPRWKPLRDLGGWATALVVGCVIAVVRSYRLPAIAAPVRDARAGWWRVVVLGADAVLGDDGEDLAMR